MSHINESSFYNAKWEDKVLSADALWAQIKAGLAAQNIALPTTPRRPDVRMIVNNVSGTEIRFKNPGNHAGEQEEIIPGNSDKSAVMIMVKGQTLEEQYRNAAVLYNSYELGENGLSAEFIQDLRDGKLSNLVDEAYGPAPFEQQASKLVDVTWSTAEAAEPTEIIPQKGAFAAFGARAATDETVFLAQFHIYVKGTGTTAELVESSGMNIAVSSDWQTKQETTRPIVPSVGRVYYGAHFDNIPTAIVHPDGKVKEVDLKDGRVITLTQAVNTPPSPSTPKTPGL